MKFNVEVDCTPEEARRMIGLPDMTPVHDKYIATLTNAMDGVAPTDMIEGMMRNWAPMGDASMGAGIGAGMELWRKMFETGLSAGKPSSG